VTRLICVLGSAPGIGKSTLCQGLLASFDGQHVDHFAEEDILSASEFAEVASEFRSTGVVAMATFLAATKAYVARVERFDVAIADSLLPYLPSLLAFGHTQEEIATFLRELAEVVRPVDPILVFLDGDPARALRRAVEREEPGWLEWFVGKLGRYDVTPRVHDEESAVAYLNAERAATLSLLRDWRVLVVDRADEASPEDLLRRALEGLGRMDG
jgi:hypothetical protein